MLNRDSDLRLRHFKMFLEEALIFDVRRIIYD